MKNFLEQFVYSLVNNDLEAAKSFHSQYIEAKAKSVMEDAKLDKDLVKGHCDDCGEEVTTTDSIVNKGKWTCPKCGSKHFEKDVVTESMLPKHMLKDYESRAESEREAGGSVTIDNHLPTVTVNMSDGSEYFFQEHEASELLDEVPDNISPEDYILAIAQGW